VPTSRFVGYIWPAELNRLHTTPYLQYLAYSFDGHTHLTQLFFPLQDPKYEHIGEEDRNKIRQKCKETTDFVFPKVAQHDTLPKTHDPVILAADINQWKEVCISNPFVLTFCLLSFASSL